MERGRETLEISDKRWRYSYPIVGACLSIVGAISPFIVVAAAGTLADFYGCGLHEGFAQPCMIFGEDYGKALYAMGMFGWLMLATLPIGAGAFLLCFIWLLVVFVRNIYVRRNYRV